MKINKLAFETISTSDGRIAFMCPQLGICEIPSPGNDEGLGYRLEALVEQCEETLVLLWDNGELVESPVLSGLLESIDLIEVRHQVQLRNKEWAVLRNYPSLAGHWNVALAIPSIDWDEPEEEWYHSKTAFKKAHAEWLATEKREQEAWDALICDGKNNPKWIDWIQWITKEKLSAYVECQQREVWERWKTIGLPVLSFAETLKG